MTSMSWVHFKALLSPGHIFTHAQQTCTNYFHYNIKEIMQNDYLKGGILYGNIAKKIIPKFALLVIFTSY